MPSPVGLAMLVALAGCASPGVAPLCEAPPTEEVAAMCTIDRARAETEAGRPEAGLAACAGLPPGRWRDECRFRVAEAEAVAGQLGRAIEVCEEASSFSRMCIGHVAWLRSESLVEAGPADAGAAAAVEALVAGLPERGGEGGRSRWGSREVARGAAWHGIYAGSGSADPTAARGAGPEAAALARGAFAWEAVRLLGPTTEPAQLMEAVLAVWRGEAAAPRGAPLPQACWETRLVPRRQLGYAEAPTLRTWSGGERFVAEEAETDLRVAVLEARWAAGADFEAAFLAELARSPERVLRLTAARHAGAAVEAVPELGAVLGADAELLGLARAVREATEHGSAGRSVAPKDGTRCGG